MYLIRSASLLIFDLSRYLTHFVYPNIINIYFGYSHTLYGGIEMDYISVKEASERWNVSERWIQKLCEEGRINGVKRFGHSWMIPKDAKKPNDLRKKGGGNYVQPST